MLFKIAAGILELDIDTLPPLACISPSDAIRVFCPHLLNVHVKVFEHSSE
jgi:hypothetical protein